MSKSKYTKAQFENDLQQLEKLIHENNSQSQSNNNQFQSNNNQFGGKVAYVAGQRHFRVVELDGKEVKIGMVKIKVGQTPLNAARKLLMSIADEKGLKKLSKLNLKAKYVIQETTRGSAHKMFGPYSGKYVKYTAEELKKAKTSDGKVSFTMKPVVKLAKKGSNHTGGSMVSK